MQKPHYHQERRAQSASFSGIFALPLHSANDPSGSRFSFTASSLRLRSISALLDVVERGKKSLLEERRKEVSGRKLILEDFDDILETKMSISMNDGKKKGRRTSNQRMLSSKS